MKLTPAELQKLIKETNLELQGLMLQEKYGVYYTASISEDAEKLKPDYDLLTNLNEQHEMMKKLTHYKHALNEFNQNTVIPEFNLTIDELLVQMPIMKERVKRLREYKDSMGRQRVESSYLRSSNEPEYKYANFDRAVAEEQYKLYNDLLKKMQLAIDNINSTRKIKIED